MFISWSEEFSTKPPPSRARPLHPCGCGRLADPATAVAMVPMVDRRVLRRLRLGPLRMGVASVDAGRGVVRLTAALCGPVVERLPRPEESLPAMLDGRSLNRRRLPACVTAIGPYEAVAEVTGPAALLVPGTVMTLTVARPWATPFRLRGRIVLRGASFWTSACHLLDEKITPLGRRRR